jgi:hypothetical protein
VGDLKVNIGVMGRPELKRSLERQAQAESRSTSNLAERLLVWAMEQLEAAGDSQKLLAWRAQPPAPDVKSQTEMERRVYEAGKPAKERKYRRA